MTVAELIKKLEKLDPELPVVVGNDDDNAYTPPHPFVRSMFKSLLDVDLYFLNVTEAIWYDSMNAEPGSLEYVEVVEF